MNIMKKLSSRAASLLLVITLFLSLCAPSLAATPVEQATSLIEISDILTYYSMDFNSETSMLEEMLAEAIRNDPELYDKMLEYMFGQLDRYSHYFTEEEYAASYPRSEPYVGVGLIANPSYPFGLVVDGFVEGGSAAESGLQTGDVVVTVGGVNVELMNYSEAVMLIRGEKNTKVKLEVRRDGHEGLITVQLERRSLAVSNIHYENMGGGVGKIKIDRFDSMSDIMDFINIYNSIPYDEDIRSVIIDLRDNPGGEVGVLFNMMNYMLPDTKALLFTLTTGAEHEFFLSTGAGTWTPNELIFLVNERTASCAEIFAGSFQQLGLAKLVGVKTYGKGRSQYHVPTSGGGVVVVTAYDITLPDGKTYDGIGITPDIVVEQGSEPYAVPKLRVLDYTREVKYGTVSTRVTALQERLSALGIFPGTPSGKYDDLTRWSVNVLQKYCELPVSDNADKATLAKLKELIGELSGETAVVDTQLETALKLATEAAAKPLKNPLKPRNSRTLEDLQ